MLIISVCFLPPPLPSLFLFSFSVLHACCGLLQVSIAESRSTAVGGGGGGGGAGGSAADGKTLARFANVFPKILVMDPHVVSGAEVELWVELYVPCHLYVYEAYGIL